MTILYENVSTTLGKDPIFIVANHSPEPFDIALTSIAPFELSEYGYPFAFTGMHMEFHRNSIGVLIGGYYVPTFIFSIFSLVSYSIDPDMVPGRLGLLVTLDLIFSNVYNSVQGPENRGFSYIEVWMVGLQIPMIIGIMEYALLLTKRRYKTVSSEYSVNVINVKPPRKFVQKTELIDFEAFSKKIDKWTFIGCFIYIMIFITIYGLVAISI